MAERQFGPYRLVRQIAVGGMAEIHLAKTKGIAGFEKYVALKMIHPNLAEDDQFIEMLVDEAKIAVQLTHANIAQTFDLGRVGDTYYITMEYVDGSDLYKVLRRASETDVEMPLDICAFIGKEVASALDHAHRKRDHSGKSLGIVHRDVSPQNVLVSYSGEVKLVDFGIAKATSKARQTAVGVIKGKYYYMSPEQAWGDPIDHRSDIFSAGIVLYEMMTGQMLYLEEDLQRLLDMVRKADIAPPTRLRKNIPPQLERIVMHALAKVPGERYQSAGDFATDLERFLHAYSPVFTAAKVAGILRKVVGESMGVADEDPQIEVREGALSTQELRMEDLAHAGDELRDENSMIFNMDELRKQSQPPSEPKPVPRMAPAKQSARPAQPSPSAPDRIPRTPGAVPSAPGAGQSAAAQSARQPLPAKAVAPGARPASTTQPPPAGRTAAPGARPASTTQPPPAGRIPSVAKPAPVAPRTQQPKPRQRDEETRELSPPGVSGDDSGLLTLSAAAPSPLKPGARWDTLSTQSGSEDDLDGVGEHTMIGTPDFLANASGDDGLEGGDATMITTLPTAPSAPDTSEHNAQTPYEEEDDTIAPDGSDDDGPTMTRDFTKGPQQRKPGPAALAGKIQTPSVSALRTPKPSRRTPPGGVPQHGNVLQQMIQAQPSEAMPSAGRPRTGTRPPPMPPLQAPPPQYAADNGQQQPQYPLDVSALPLSLATPPGMAIQPMPGVPAHLQPYAHMQGYNPNPGQQQHYPPQAGYPPQYQQQPYQGQPQYPEQYPQGYPGQMPPTTPGALYQLNPYGAPAPQPMSVTGQLRLFEANQLPQAFTLNNKKRWVGVVIAGVLAVSVAAGVTFFIIRATRDGAPTVAAIKVESSPPGAEVSFDGTRLSDLTPLTIENVPVGTRHDIKVELAQYTAYTETIDVPKSGSRVPVMALLKKVTGKIFVDTKPGGAEIRINGELRGRSPMTLADVDMASTKTIEIRLKDYQPIKQDLKFPANGQIVLDLKLEK